MKQQALGIWETHLGTCPECQRNEIDDREDSQSETPLGEASPSKPTQADSVHPIIKQIIDRDCHVGSSAEEVVRHVISKLRKGYETLRSMPPEDRASLVEQCVQHHRGNLNEYVEVMSGFTRTLSDVSIPASGSLAGPELVRLMRKHKVTIESLAFRLGTSRKRVRQVPNTKLDDPLAVLD